MSRTNRKHRYPQALTSLLWNTLGKNLTVQNLKYRLCQSFYLKAFYVDPTHRKNVKIFRSFPWSSTKFFFSFFLNAYLSIALLTKDSLGATLTGGIPFCHNKSYELAIFPPERLGNTAVNKIQVDWRQRDMPQLVNYPSSCFVRGERKGMALPGSLKPSVFTSHTWRGVHLYLFALARQPSE